MKFPPKLTGLFAALLLVLALPGCNKESDGPYDQYGEMKVFDDEKPSRERTEVRTERRVESVPAPRMIDGNATQPSEKRVSRTPAPVQVQSRIVQQPKLVTRSTHVMIGELNVDD